MSSNKLSKDITDSEIDDLFNNDNISILKDDESTQQNIVPSELSIENKNSSKHVDRPKKQTDTIKKELKELDDKYDGFKKVREYIKNIINYKTQSKKKEQINSCIINNQQNVNLDPGTECTFHIYQPKHIMGDNIICSCRFCSSQKDFTQKEWDEYCIKYRKWL